MAIEGALTCIPGVSASADLSAKQFYIMKYSGVGTVTVGAATTDKPCGVLQDTPASGVRAAVAFSGLTKVIAGGTITAGDTVGMDSSGRAVTYVEGTDTTKYRVGTAQVSGVSGDIISVLLQLTGRLA